jgi:uncharacterized protein YegL
MENQIIDRPIREASEPHVALTLVLDVSGSMQLSNAIQSLNLAVNKMIDQMKKDERLRNIVDLAIFVFGTHGRPNIYQGFRAIADCDQIKLEANDENTYVCAALEQAVSVMRTRCAIYDKAGGAYKPWIVLITDGEFHDGDAKFSEISSIMKERESRGKLQFFGLGVDGYDRTQLENLTNDPTRVIDVKVADFKEFFNWVGRSMKAVSESTPNEKVALPPLQFTI